jgi:tetratricopeptide (TPR) repeat protein
MNRRARRIERRQAKAPAALEQVLFNAGLAHHQAGRLSEAAQQYRQALEANPQHADSLHLLGVIAIQSGRHDLAVDLIGQAITLNGTVALFHCNLGAALKPLGRVADAINSFWRAVSLDPAHADAHSNLGAALKETGELEQAQACYHRALALRPDFPEAHNGLAAVLSEQGNTQGAIASYTRALTARPAYAEAQCGLGVALATEGRLLEAVTCYHRAISLNPEYPEAYHNLGTALAEQGELDAAAACYRRAVALRPGWAAAHFHLGMVLLTQGDMAAGWAAYEWRWQMPGHPANPFTVPQWRGEPAEGRTLLIHAEQGYGDTMQFCRYAALAAGRGFRVVLTVQRPLARLLCDLSGVDQVVAHGDPLPPFDLHCPMMSLPLAFGTDLDTIPHAAPYLRADTELAAQWQRRLAGLGQTQPRIGLVWAGTGKTSTNPRRSMNPALLGPLLALPGLQFFSLQKDCPAPGGMIDLMDGMADFADTAALIANLDLVISVDTAVAHLAAAMGKPVWMLDRFDADWRWLRGRDDSPWYPTLRLYRQPAPGDWFTVLTEVIGDLLEMVPGVMQDAAPDRSVDEARDDWQQSTPPFPPAQRTTQGMGSGAVFG